MSASESTPISGPLPSGMVTVLSFGNGQFFVFPHDEDASDGEITDLDYYTSSDEASDTDSVLPSGSPQNETRLSAAPRSPTQPAADTGADLTVPSADVAADESENTTHFDPPRFLATEHQAQLTSALENITLTGQDRHGVADFSADSSAFYAPHNTPTSRRLPVVREDSSEDEDESSGVDSSSPRAYLPPPQRRQLWGSSSTIVASSPHNYSDWSTTSDSHFSASPSPTPHARPRTNWKAGQRLRRPDGTWGPIIRGYVRPGTENSASDTGSNGSSRESSRASHSPTNNARSSSQEVQEMLLKDDSVGSERSVFLSGSMAGDEVEDSEDELYLSGDLQPLSPAPRRLSPWLSSWATQEVQVPSSQEVQPPSSPRVGWMEALELL